MYRKRPTENRFGYGVGIFLALGASLYMVFNMIEGWDKYRESNRRLEASTQELFTLENQLNDLKREKLHASSTSGIEMQVRSKFDLAKPDENVVFIISEDTPVPKVEEKGIKKMINSFKNFFN